MLSANGLRRRKETVSRGRELLDVRPCWNVNSTAPGGGVAEMLQSLSGYVQGAGLDARWVAVGGDAEFFR